MSQWPKERFLKACGLSEDCPLVLEVEGPQEGEHGRWTLAQPFAVVGRNPGADVVLGHEEVSSRHAYFQVIEGRVFCVDLGSRTGVAWGDEPARSGWVDRDAGVRIGPYRIRAGAAMATTDPGDPLTTRFFGRSDVDWPALGLEFPQRPDQRLSRVSRVLTMMGRSTGCRLSLVHADVSKVHCALLRSQEGVWLIDCFGRGGTRVNGELIRWVLLEDGDEIGVGPFRMRVRAGSSSAEAESGEGMFTLGGELARMSSRAVPTLSRTGRRRLDLPVPAASQTELLEPYLASLTTHFGQMQQQMFEQFQQTMLTMGQMFSNLHREQMAEVREELARLRQVNHDLTALHAELAASVPGVAPPVIPAPTPPPADPASVATVEALTRIENLLKAAHTRSVDAGTGALLKETKPEPVTAPFVASPRPNGAKRNGAPAPVPAPAPVTSSPAARPGVMPDGTVHALLSQRIAALKVERESHWKKILRLIFGR